MSKHTPGPSTEKWIAKPHIYGDLDGKHKVERILDNTPGPPITIAENLTPTRARLIAKAPKMARFLESMATEPCECGKLSEIAELTIVCKPCEASAILAELERK